MLHCPLVARRKTYKTYRFPRRTCDTDGQRQHQVVDPLQEEVSPLVSQLWRQLLRNSRRGRREEPAQIHDQGGVLAHKQLHPGVPQTGHVLAGDLAWRQIQMWPLVMTLQRKQAMGGVASTSPPTTPSWSRAGSPSGCRPEPWADGSPARRGSASSPPRGSAGPKVCWTDCWSTNNINTISCYLHP